MIRECSIVRFYHGSAWLGRADQSMPCTLSDASPSDGQRNKEARGGRFTGVGVEDVEDLREEVALAGEVPPPLASHRLPRGLSDHGVLARRGRAQPRRPRWRRAGFVMRSIESGSAVRPVRFRCCLACQPRLAAGILAAWLVLDAGAVGIDMTVGIVTAVIGGVSGGKGREEKALQRGWRQSGPGFNGIFFRVVWWHLSLIPCRVGLCGWHFEGSQEPWIAGSHAPAEPRDDVPMSHYEKVLFLIFLLGSVLVRCYRTSKLLH